jgi:hypothetical protein
MDASSWRFLPDIGCDGPGGSAAACPFISWNVAARRSCREFFDFSQARRLGPFICLAARSPIGGLHQAVSRGTIE